MDCPIMCGKCCSIWHHVAEIKEKYPDRSHSDPCPYLGKGPACALPEKAKPLECQFFLCTRSALTRLLRAKQAKDPSVTQVTLREALVDLEHRKWSHWATQMLNNLTPENLALWKEMATKNSEDFSEKEIVSDRVWADCTLSIVRLFSKAKEDDKKKLDTPVEQERLTPKRNEVTHLCDEA